MSESMDASINLSLAILDISDTSERLFLAYIKLYHATSHVVLVNQNERFWKHLMNLYKNGHKDSLYYFTSFLTSSKILIITS